MYLIGFDILADIKASTQFSYFMYDSMSNRWNLPVANEL